MKQTDIEKIVHGMLHIARPLEITRVRYLISDGSKEEVIDELKKFQNSDGGFGHGLEPDFINPFSSATQSWVATNIIKELDMDAFHPVVIQLIDYLAHTFDTTINRWYAIDSRNRDYPHAPWWENEGDLSSMNPSASLAGFIIKYGNPILPIYAKAKKVVDEALDMIIDFNKEIERHELRCLIEMLDDIGGFYLKDPKYIKAKNQMILRMDDTIEKDEKKWFTDYVAKPSVLIKSHPSFGSEVFFDLLVKEIEIALNHQNDEHLWDITWQWSSYQEAFEKAQKDWQGIIAYDYIKLIKDLGITLED
jgi:hypothetical protein